MFLAALTERYLAEHPYGVSETYARQLRVSVSAWEKQAGRRLTLDDLADTQLNAYIDWLRANRRPHTCRTRRGNLLILWHWAYQESLTDVAPRRIRRLRRIDHNPEAWTTAEVRALLTTAEQLSGCHWRTTIRRAAWWSSLIRAGYDTGLRLGDLLAMPVSSISETLGVVQHKTGRYVLVQLRPATIAAIDQTLADQPRTLVWPLWCGEETFFQHFRRLVTTAAIRPGTFRWLRRSAATACESVQPGSGTVLLGHASRATTEAWYIDRSLLDRPPLPPL